MDNFDMDKYFDDFFSVHTNAGESIEDIVAKFTESANRALKVQREEEEAKHKAEEEAKCRAELQKWKISAFTDVMDCLMEFLLDYDYITAEEYDEFWKKWDEESCLELLAELDHLASVLKTFQSIDLDALLKDFLTPLEKDKIQEVSEKSNTNTSADTGWKMLRPVDSTSQQTVPVQKDDKNMNKNTDKKGGKTPVIRVKLPKSNDFMDILNDFLGGLK